MKNGTTNSRALASVDVNMAAHAAERAAQAAEDRTARIAKWTCRGLFLLAVLSWLAALVGAIDKPAVFAAVLTAGVTSTFGMIVTGLLLNDHD